MFTLKLSLVSTFSYFSYVHMGKVGERQYYVWVIAQIPIQGSRKCLSIFVRNNRVLPLYLALHTKFTKKNVFFSRAKIVLQVLE